MTTMALHTSSTPAAWAAFAATRGANEPAWAVAQRNKALGIANSLAYPDRSLDLWRRTDR